MTDDAGTRSMDRDGTKEGPAAAWQRPGKAHELGLLDILE